MIVDLPPLELGRKYFALTCVGIGPTVFRCDCGAEVRKRSLTHIRNGMRSCGCLARASREAKLAKGLSARSFEVVDKTPGDKTRFSTWDVRCLRCGEESTVGDTHLRFGRIGSRCSKCPR